MTLFLVPTFAQPSEGGMPPSFLYGKQAAKTLSLLPEHVVMPIDFDVKQLRFEDALNEGTGEAVPLNCAHLITTCLNMDNSGRWLTLSNGQRIWQLSIEAKDAIALTLLYEQFYIPQGGKLFIYSKDKTHVLGAYTAVTNPTGGKFVTDFVAGDAVVLEYVASETTDDALPSYIQQPRITIKYVGYGYNHLWVMSTPASKSYGDALPCNVNVACSEGDPWRDQIDGVVRLRIARVGSSSVSLCTGAIVNNTRQDFTPYVLTAYHCADDRSAADLLLSSVDFHFEYANCFDNTSTTSQPDRISLSGLIKLTDSPIDGGSDGLLLKLTNTIPEIYHTYYNGWDATETMCSATIGIHHPRGDVKKISTSNTTISSYTWSGSDGSNGLTNAHWAVRNYVVTANGHGILESGSSGSPLFNMNKRIIGTLTGGNTISNCSEASNRVSRYGKMSYHWDRYNAPAGMFKTFLDPDNTGIQVVDGIRKETTGNYTVTFNVLNATDLTPLTNATITFNNVMNTSGNYIFTNMPGPSSYSYTITNFGFNAATGYLFVKGDTTFTVLVTPMFPSGSGTSDDPFLITNRTEMDKLRSFLGSSAKDIHFRITADLNFSGGGAWVPIGTADDMFYGKLHGGGHTIQNLNISKNSHYLGLFGALGGSAYVDSLSIISRVIEDVAATGVSYIGSIAGYLNSNLAGDSIVIAHCFSNAVIYGGSAPSHIGGIAGYLTHNVANSKIIIASCVNTGNIIEYSSNISANSHSGGLVGSTNGTQGATYLRNCYVQSNVAGKLATDNSAGGIIGYVGHATVIENCYAIGAVTGYTTGGIAGRATNGTLTINNSLSLQDSLFSSNATSGNRIYGYTNTSDVTLSNNFANATMSIVRAGNVTTVSPDGNGVAGANVNFEQAKTASWYDSTLPSWNFDTTWTLPSSNYPYLKHQSALPVVKFFELSNCTVELPAAGRLFVSPMYNPTSMQEFTAVSGDNMLNVNSALHSTVFGFFNITTGNAPSYRVTDTSFAPVSIKPQIVDAFEIKAYPNPTQKTLTIEVPDGAVGTVITVEIYTTTGGLCQTHQFEAPLFTLDLSTCPNGTLLVKIIKNGQSTSLKVIKQ
ncbi:hypothetical protein FACS1894201_01130 [Bacteroidia bacterium]|nr:hypothetical protein FACS1894201_01130 [Bacteroidia bacterium]